MQHLCMVRFIMVIILKCIEIMMLINGNKHSVIGQLCFKNLTNKRLDLWLSEVELEGRRIG